MFFHSLIKELSLINFTCLVAILLVFGGGIYTWRYLFDKSYKSSIRGLRLGFILFIVSEVMFFFSFFWAYFHSSLSPNIEMEVNGLLMVLMLFFKITNSKTIILLSSGATITLAHLNLIKVIKKKLWSIISYFTISFGVYSIQAYEYRHAPFQYQTVFMVQFLYFDRISWIARNYGTIFITIQLIV